jgi:hypothetical protein
MFKQEVNPLQSWYFSKSNQENIQGMISRDVYRRTGVKVGRQNPNDLLAIMSSVYSVNSYDPYGDLKRQVSNMNNLTAQKAISQVIGGIDAYKQYLKDIDTRPMPSDLPINTSSYGKKISINNKW